jgi:hypothetical protein
MSVSVGLEHIAKARIDPVTAIEQDKPSVADDDDGSSVARIFKH